MVAVHRQAAGKRAGRREGRLEWRVPPTVAGQGASSAVLHAPGEVRALLVRAGLCAPSGPAVTLELFGNLRLKTGCARLPLHAGSIGEALAVLRRVYPVAERLLPPPEALGEHYRFSVNARTVTTDLEHRLQPGDHVILFSASVGG